MNHFLGRICVGCRLGMLRKPVSFSRFKPLSRPPFQSGGKAAKPPVWPHHWWSDQANQNPPPPLFLFRDVLRIVTVAWRGDAGTRETGAPTHFATLQYVTHRKRSVHLKWLANRQDTPSERVIRLCLDVAEQVIFLFFFF